MDMEVGRKVLPHLFKRNNYHTIGVGKLQPLDGNKDMHESPDTPGEYFYSHGTRFNGFDRSFYSKSYCCVPGAGVDFNIVH